MSNHDVYLAFDDTDVLLYVGVTSNSFQRYDYHKHQSAWWPEVAYLRILHWETRQDAFDVEAYLIDVCRPPHNKRMGQPGADRSRGRVLLENIRPRLREVLDQRPDWPSLMSTSYGFESPSGWPLSGSPVR